MRGGGHDVAVRDRVLVQTGGDQTGDVRHVHEKERVRLVGDLAQAGEVDGARIGGGAGEDHAGLVLHGEAFDLVVVEAFGLGGDAVGHDVEEVAAEVHRMAVREVSAVVEAHGEHGVAGVQQREIHRHVRLAARVGLHVRGFGAEEFLRAVDRELFHLVDEFAAVVVALARIAFGVLVGQDGALGGADGRAREVFGGDELDAVELAVGFLVDQRGDLRVGGTNRGDVVVGALFEDFQTAHVAGVAGERGGEPHFDELLHLRLVHVVGGEDQHVRTVVGAAGGGVLLAERHDGADAVEAVGGDDHARAAAAEQDAELDLALGDGFRHRGTEHGVVVPGVVHRGPEVLHGESLAFEERDEFRFQFESAVVGGDAHGQPLGAVPVRDLVHLCFLIDWLFAVEKSMCKRPFPPQV